MSAWEHELVEGPKDPRARELWLQHAAGFIIFENVRRYAIERIDPALSEDARPAVQKGIDDAVYGLMMVIDGVSGGLSNASQTVSIDFAARLESGGDSGNDEVLMEVDLRRGDGMCMGYHGWLEGNYGEHPVAAPKPSR